MSWGLPTLSLTSGEGCHIFDQPFSPPMPIPCPLILYECTYIVPVYLYGCETWSSTKLQCSRIDAFDMWALRKILRIPYTRHVTNVEVRATTGSRPLSHLVTDRRLRVFGHIARSSPQEDHHRAVAAVIRGLPPDHRSDSTVVVLLW